MSTWTRTDKRGIRVRFTITPDQRGNVTLTREEAEGLLRTGGWTPEAEVGLTPKENAS
ncbi:hypothetical protein [Brachybacterium sp. UMB0905]|uniref:hypothetical protein n=1 Tax=Brachybacterium sp. UMB0905 TaxID=2069310 RepID=UPI0013046364|nr:hypothetical protein [Brachybacterium sp. UMB0905]